jgi:ribosomal protein S27E
MNQVHPSAMISQQKYSWQVRRPGGKSEKSTIVDGRTDRAYLLDREVEAYSLRCHPLGYLHPRPSEIKRARGLAILREFALVQCPRQGCTYFMIVQRKQQTVRCAACGARIWLAHVRPLAISNFITKLRVLIPRLHGRSDRKLFPSEAGDLDRFDAPHYIKLIARRRGQSGQSSCGETPGEPRVVSDESSLRSTLPKQDLKLSETTPAQSAHVSPREAIRGEPRVESPTQGTEQ